MKTSDKLLAFAITAGFALAFIGIVAASLIWPAGFVIGLVLVTITAGMIFCAMILRLIYEAILSELSCKRNIRNNESGYY